MFVASRWAEQRVPNWLDSLILIARDLSVFMAWPKQMVCHIWRQIFYRRLKIVPRGDFGFTYRLVSRAALRRHFARSRRCCCSPGMRFFVVTAGPE